MFGIGLSIFMIAFGVFIKFTKNPSLASSKKFAWLFIILGVLTLVGRIINMNIES